MPTYTVHAPPRPNAMDPTRVVFLRDGFHVWAFIASSLWLLVYRQWLALLIYVVVTGAVTAALVWLGAETMSIVAAGICMSLLVGLEAASIRRWTFARRGWTTLGFVVGEDHDIAEQRFFARWAERPQPQRVGPEAQRPLEPNPPFRRPPERDVIGLFPTPDRAR
jgi:Protein of unknown function (DUF2628)